ncbi:MAG: DUF1566 domain-containing protein, partial [Nanoarchaeota archaeon]|nr:DUF1566 domain-containing protein [Nanoarchaeota archaeon]
MQNKNSSSFPNFLLIILVILTAFLLIFLIQEKIITGKVSENPKISLVNDCGYETILYNFGELCWQKFQMPLSANNWSHANFYCKNLTLANYTNWRLPTDEELWKIRREMKTNSSLLNETRFWTDTPHEFKTMHKYINFRTNYRDYALDLRQGYGVKCI